MLIIPFTILPPKTVLGLSKKFKNAGRFTSAFTPQLDTTLLEAETETDAKEYCAIALAAATANAAFIAALTLLVGALSKNSNPFLPAIAAAALVALMSYATIIAYPNIIATRRARKIDGQLIPAMRQLLIQLRSGVPLFNALAALTTDYGEASNEFKKIIKKINAGMPEIDAIGEAAAGNPSLQSKRILWQLSNSLKVGSDVSSVIESLITELTANRIQQIRSYGQELAPWMMIYMMAAVILPSLGITMLIVISSFVSIGIPAIALPLLLAFVIAFQLFFMNFIATRRPQT